MFEMSVAGEYHRHAVFVACVDTQLVFYASARLHDSGNARLSRRSRAVVEREERVACENRALRIDEGVR